MIEITQLKKDYGGTVVLNGVSARFGPNEKIGLIGRNGAGKTTLLRILTGGDHDFSGKVARSGGIRLEYVPQSFPDFEGTALDYIIAPYRTMRNALLELEDSMGSATGNELEKILSRYGHLRSEYDAGDGDTAEERAERYLETIGLAERGGVDFASLSGGEKNVLALARALVSHPDFLILDEPGNHLDVWGLAWLERFIRDYPGTVLVVSHNRYLLDRAVSRVVELELGKAIEFAGNYSAYRMERLRRTVSGEMAWRADQKKIERLEEVVRRFEAIARVNPDPAWGRRLRARRTHLEKTKENSAERPVNPDSSFAVSFDTERSRADIALKVTDFTCGFGERVLLDGVSLLVEPGERVALVGANGSGKTTFLNAIIRSLADESSRIRVGPSMKVAYCSQHGDGLDRDATVLSACVDAGSKNADDAWKVLSRFLFAREALEQKIGALSGGELNRLQLAIAVIARANFLILDEPTNHLDISACEAVEDALLEFAGTVLVVSHDRYFLDRVATRIVEIDDGDFVEYDGNFSEFWYRKYGTGGAARFARGTNGSGTARDSRARMIAQAKGNALPPGSSGEREKTANLERRIIALEAEREILERKMVDAYASGDLASAKSLGSRLADNAKVIARLYDEWV